MILAAEHYPVLIIVISMLSAFTILIAGWVNKKTCLPISLATIFVQLLLAFSILHHVVTSGTIHYWLGGWAPPWGIEYVVDAFNAYVLVIVLFICLLTVIYAKRSIEKELPRKIVSFYVVFQLLVTGLCGIMVTGDVFNLYVFLEIASLAAYALIAAAGGRSLKASYNYVIMGSIGACFYLLGAGFLYSVTGSLNMSDLSYLLPPLYENKVVQAAFVFFVVGISIKMALFPLHIWQPDAYTYAPSAVSVIIAAAMSKVSIYAFIRIFFSVFTTDFIHIYVPITTVLSWIAAIAIIVGSVIAIMQTNLKRMLAYSSVSQIGYIVLGVALFSTQWGLYGALIHILNHAIAKGCLFMVAGAIIYRTGLRSIKDFEGLGKKMPYTCAAFTLAALSMIGVPPTVGFITKLCLVLASLEAVEYVYVAVILASTLLNLVYFWRVIERMYFVKKEGEGEKEHAIKKEEAPVSMVVPALVLGLLCVIVGILWLAGAETPLLPIVEQAVNGLLRTGVAAP
uniref:NAD(P)H-quinone oxidoreductase subunit 2, chloroplastic n=1 Tax=Candidatus Methanophagaceae archaeon ANME-1 ERB6 TaxID=2759912 RepID=A0A7G9Z0H9_9EURY|nr:NAD(P)H-quinone oxidoreductase subunit 2, chloroplastic [Methanosarcinales archaeon ANME-1 ERB6]